MNNKFITIQGNDDKVIVSNEFGELKVFSNNNIREKLKLENNIEILTKEYDKVENEYNELKKIKIETTDDAKKQTKETLIFGGVGAFFISAITSFSVISVLVSTAIALGIGADVIAIQLTAKKKQKNISSQLEVAALNKRLAYNKKYAATEKLIELLENKEILKEEFIPNHEYTVDDNYDYVFTKAEYVEPEKNLSLARIKRVCREKLDKKRR